MSVKLNVASDVISLAKGLAVIRAFDNFYKPLSLVEISNNISLSFANTQNICENLVELGYLSKIIQTTAITPPRSALNWLRVF